jgi:hypothetical protein
MDRKESQAEKIKNEFLMLNKNKDEDENLSFDLSAMDFKTHPFEKKQKNTYQENKQDKINEKTNSFPEQYNYQNNSILYSQQQLNMHNYQNIPAMQQIPNTQINQIPMMTYSYCPPNYYAPQQPLIYIPTPSYQSSISSSNNSSRMLSPNYLPSHMNPQTKNKLFNAKTSNLLSVGNKISSPAIKNNSKSSQVATSSSSTIIHADFFDKLDIDYITSQKGSKKLQKYIEETATKDNIKDLYEYIEKEIPLIVNNRFGNYFFQKLIAYLDKSKRIKLWDIIKKGNVLLFSQDEFGNHSIQGLIENADEEEEDLILNILKPYYFSLAFHKYGNFLLLKMLASFSNSNKKLIFSFIKENLISLMFHINGVVLVKKLIINLRDGSNYDRLNFIEEIKSKLFALFTDKVANFVILCLFDEWEINDLSEIGAFIIRNFWIMIDNRYSTGLIIKYLELINLVSRI